MVVALAVVMVGELAVEWAGDLAVEWAGPWGCEKASAKAGPWVVLSAWWVSTSADPRATRV